MRPVRAVIRHVSRYDRWRFALAIAGPYALLVIAVAIYVEISTRQPGSQGLEAVVLFMVTAPISLVLMLIPFDIPFEVVGQELYLLMFTVGGIFQAWILWMIARGRRNDGSRVVT
jgi:hypothetical protein